MQCLAPNKTGKTVLKRLHRQDKAKDYKKDCKRLQKTSKDWQRPKRLQKILKDCKRLKNTVGDCKRFWKTSKNCRLFVRAGGMGGMPEKDYERF